MYDNLGIENVDFKEPNADINTIDLDIVEYFCKNI